MCAMRVVHARSGVKFGAQDVVLIANAADLTECR